jgi:hypothetical protein
VTGRTAEPRPPLPVDTETHPRPVPGEGFRGDGLDRDIRQLTGEVQVPNPGELVEDHLPFELE